MFQFECCGVEGFADWTDNAGVFSNSYKGKHCGQDVDVKADAVKVPIRLLSVIQLQEIKPLRS